MRILLFVLFFLTAMAVYAKTVDVSCDFTDEIRVTKDGEWVESAKRSWPEPQESISFSMKKSLLRKLDTAQPFLAGKTDKGNMYLRKLGITEVGRLVSIDENFIIIYDGLCYISRDSRRNW